MTTPPRPPPGTSPTQWMETLLQQAQAEGAFDRVGETPDPMAGVDVDRDDENWWLRSLLKREQLQVPNAVTALRSAIAALIDALGTITEEREVRRRVAALNAEVEVSNLTMSSPLSRDLAALDIDAVLTRWRQARAAPP